MSPRLAKGERIGRFTIVAPAMPSSGQLRWFCKCDCGRYAKVFATNLYAGRSQSCGCMKGKAS